MHKQRRSSMLCFCPPLREAVVLNTMEFEVEVCSRDAGSEPCCAGRSVGVPKGATPAAPAP